jgi:hypothetical protein
MKCLIQTGEGCMTLDWEPSSYPGIYVEEVRYESADDLGNLESTFIAKEWFIDLDLQGLVNLVKSVEEVGEVVEIQSADPRSGAALTIFVRS